MQSVLAPGGVNVSCAKYGAGPPLVLIHSSFSDHFTNWQFVAPALREQFTIYSIARRGRGETDNTQGHTVVDEGRDAAAIIQAIAEPVFLLGHSYGAHCALLAAQLVPNLVSKVVAYEPAWPRIFSGDAIAHFEGLAAAGAWDDFAVSFFCDTLFVPAEEIKQLRWTRLWPAILQDAPASLHDIRALATYDFKPVRFEDVTCPVLLQFGAESKHELYATNALRAVLANARMGELPGQAHEGMTTAPDLYVRAVTQFLLS
jgi:pimeloyl-ACP methyl ester carboxylesterase